MINEKTNEELVKTFFDAPENALFDQATIAAVRGCSKATMERDRWAGTGVPFIKIGRMVRYKKADVMAWINQFKTKSSTSQAA